MLSHACCTTTHSADAQSRVELADSERDLRRWSRAGDGNRTRVLSLGSPRVERCATCSDNEMPIRKAIRTYRCCPLLRPFCRSLGRESCEFREGHTGARVPGKSSTLDGEECPAARNAL
jgi:hypothetical protein